MIAAAPAEALADAPSAEPVPLRRDQSARIVALLSDSVEDLDGDLARVDVRGEDRRILLDRRSADAELLDLLSRNWRTARADWDLEILLLEARAP